MSIEITWVSIGVMLAVLGHAYHTVVWSSKITQQLETLNSNLNRLDKELEKRDTQIAAVWRKVDGLAERVLKIESSNE